MEISNSNSMQKSLVDVNMGEKIVKQLAEKYNEKFIIKKMARQYGVGDFNNIKAICSLENNNKMNFEITYSMINETIEDDEYYIKSTSYELEDFIIKNLNDIQKEAIAKVEIFGKRSLEKKYSVEEFTSEYSSCNFLATIVIKENISEDELNNVFENLKNRYKNLYLKTLIYIVKQENFDVLYNETKDFPNISQTQIEENCPNNMYIIKLYNNEIIKIK